jgi:hypothetical protein
MSFSLFFFVLFIHPSIHSCCVRAPNDSNLFYR